MFSTPVTEAFQKVEITGNHMKLQYQKMLRALPNSPL